MGEVAKMVCIRKQNKRTMFNRMNNFYIAILVMVELVMREEVKSTFEMKKEFIIQHLQAEESQIWRDLHWNDTRSSTDEVQKKFNEILECKKELLFMNSKSESDIDEKYQSLINPIVEKITKKIANLFDEINSLQNGRPQKSASSYRYY